MFFDKYLAVSNADIVKINEEEVIFRQKKDTAQRLVKVNIFGQIFISGPTCWGKVGQKMTYNQIDAFLEQEYLTGKLSKAKMHHGWTRYTNLALPDWDWLSVMHHAAKFGGGNPTTRLMSEYWELLFNDPVSAEEVSMYDRVLVETLISAKLFNFNKKMIKKVNESLLDKYLNEAED